MARAKPGKSSFHDYLIQSILVPKAHKDVKKRGVQGAVAVAKRHGAVRVDKVDETVNYFRFRQFDPKLAAESKYVTLPLPSGVKIVSAPLSKASAKKTVRRQGAGVCEAPGSSRKRIVCADRYQDSSKNVDVIVRTTRTEHEELPKTIPLGKLIHQLGHTRISMTTKKTGASRRSLTDAEREIADVVSIDRRRGSKRELRAVANPVAPRFEETVRALFGL